MWDGRQSAMDYLTAVICMAPLGRSAPGIRPDALSSDSHAFPTGGGGMHITEVMSNMLALNTPSNVNYSGFATTPALSPTITLDDVVRMATVVPAQVINRVDKLGTLQDRRPR
jgi:predicted amidohydrolase